MFPSSLLIEVVCLGFAIVYVGKLQAGFWRVFIPLMAFIVLLEGAGWVTSRIENYKNHWMYNIGLIVEFYFYTWLFQQVLRPVLKFRYILALPLIVFTLMFLVECIQGKFVVYNSKSSLVASAFIIVYCGIYYYLLLHRSDHENLGRHPEFWVVSGVFIFYFAGTAVNVFFSELMGINVINGIPLRFFILTGLNAILYGSWCYAFQCRYRQTISSSR